MGRESRSIIHDTLLHHRTCNPSEQVLRVIPRRAIQPRQKVLCLRRNRLHTIQHRNIKEPRSRTNSRHIARLTTQVTARRWRLIVEHFVEHQREHFVELGAELVVAVAWEDEPLEAGGEYGQIAYDVGPKNRVGERDAFDGGFAQLECEDAGGGEAVEHYDCGEVASRLVCTVQGFGEYEGSGE